MWFFQLLKLLPYFLIWTFVFTLQRIVALADKIAHKVLGYGNKTIFVRRGSCQNTGECCKQIGIGLPKSWFKRPWLTKPFQWYMRAIHNFHPIEELADGMLLFKCHYLTKDNKCGIYPFRPTICRDYPATTLFGHARVHKGCGFWFIERENLGTFAEKMAKAQHEENRRNYLQNMQFPI